MRNPPTTGKTARYRIHRAAGQAPVGIAILLFDRLLLPLACGLPFEEALRDDTTLGLPGMNAMRLQLVSIPLVLWVALTGAAEPPLKPPTPDHPVLQWGPAPKGWNAGWSAGYRQLTGIAQADAPSSGSAAMPLGKLLGFSTSLVLKDLPNMRWRSVQYAGLGVSLQHHPNLGDLNGFRALMASEAGEKGVSKAKLDAKFQFAETRFQNFRAFRMSGSDKFNLRDLYLVEVVPSKKLWALLDGYYTLSDYNMENPTQPLDLSACRAQFAAGLAQLLQSLHFGESLALTVESVKNEPLHLQFCLTVSSAGKSEADLRKLLAQKLGALKSPRFQVHLFDRHLNSLKLQDDFKANGEWDSRLKHLKPAAPRQAPDTQPASVPGSGVSGGSADLGGPASATATVNEGDDSARCLPIPVKITPEHTGTVNAFLCFQRLARYSRTHGAQGVRVPSFDAPLTVRVEVELVHLGEKGEDIVIASTTKDVTLDHIARALGLRYETPAIQKPDEFQATGRGQIVESASGSLQDYTKPPHGDPQGLQRVKVQRKSGPVVGTIVNPGEFPGTLLLPDDALRVGDRVRIDATKMAAHGVVGSEPPMRIRPGLIALRLAFLDGTLAEIRVREDAGPYDLVLGVSTSDYRPSGTAWAYFSADFSKNQVADKVIEFTAQKLLPRLAPGVGVFNTVKDAYEFIQFGDGGTTQHVRLNSRVFGLHYGNDRLDLTTLEGAPVIYQKTHCPAGLPVPAGKTAIVKPDAPPIVQDTDAETRKQAVAALGAGRDGAAGSLADWFRDNGPWIWRAGGAFVALLLVVFIAGAVWWLRRRGATRMASLAAVPSTPVTPADVARFCTQCGAQRASDHDVKYCSRCGQRYDE